jgi:exodeoxyribonuclease VII large subunit
MAGQNFFEFQRSLREPEPAATTETPPLSVGELTVLIDRALKAGVGGMVRVLGELSNVKLYPQSGHLYFTLKDADACIDCVMFKPEASRLRFRPTNGTQLVASGRIGVYAQRGRYQLYVTSLQPVGRGALELAFRELKARLEAEGLFKPERKRPLPRFPTRIALVTSTRTAALQDMLKVLRRFPWLRISVLDTPVQGDGAAARIAAALGSISASRFDVAVLARGGGSLEDLWAFNEEAAARAVVRCAVPVITGIGHQTDVSICDLAADVHAHTPTEAARVLVKDWQSAEELLRSFHARIGRWLRNEVSACGRRLQGIERHPFFRRPTDRVQHLRQLLDDREQALAGALRRAALRVSARLTRLEGRLSAQHPRQRLRMLERQVAEVQRRLQTGQKALLGRARARLDSDCALLEAVSPRAVLRRGYTITSRKSDQVVLRQPAEVRTGDILVTTFADGSIESIAQEPGPPELFP